MWGVVAGKTSGAESCTGNHAEILWPATTRSNRLKVEAVKRGTATDADDPLEQQALTLSRSHRSVELDELAGSFSDCLSLACVPAKVAHSPLPPLSTSSVHEFERSLVHRNGARRAGGRARALRGGFEAKGGPAGHQALPNAGQSPVLLLQLASRSSPFLNSRLSGSFECPCLTPCSLLSGVCLSLPLVFASCSRRGANFALKRCRFQLSRCSYNSHAERMRKGLSYSGRTEIQRARNDGTRNNDDWGGGGERCYCCYDKDEKKRDHMNGMERQVAGVLTLLD